MRLLIQHRNLYRYPKPAALGPHLIRLRPALHARAAIESYGLTVEPSTAQVRWQQDPYGNRVARVTFPEGVRVPHLEVTVELAVDVRPVNPFDFLLDDRCEVVPFAYPPELKQDLLPFLDVNEPAVRGGERLKAFLDELPRSGPTVPLIIQLNEKVNQRIQYIIREEAGIHTPEETLAAGKGSCRDSAMLLIAVLRSRGLAARFVSGYLVQLTDEGMIPNAPRGVGRDVVDLHAWAEVFLPGAGWIGLDATSGLLTGEGHIPLASTASPALAAPIEGTSDTQAEEVRFSMTVGRLGHEPRPTAPYTDEVWQALCEGGDRADAVLRERGVKLTIGGEPTFNAREHTELPEWNGDALGETKWKLGVKLAEELRRRLSPGAALLLRAGKHYPGESLPRWALDICGRRDREPLWTGEALASGDNAGTAQAREVAQAVASRLGLAQHLLPAFEDPWRFLQDEENLPVDVDPLKANLNDSEERRRLAKVLGQGLGNEVGFVLPLGRDTDGRWVSDPWQFRRRHLFLLPGDSPLGLRLPLRSLSEGDPLSDLWEEPYEPIDPRREPSPEEAKQHKVIAKERASRLPRVRTALAFEARGGTVHVFLPPLARAEDFFDLVSIIDQAREHTGIAIQLEGYPPPSSPLLYRFAVTPDPGVLEVNLPPVSSNREYTELVGQVFDAALHAGLHSEKYLMDGRMAGSGGGNHITVGGPTALSSPLLTRPELLASLITFVQHHPSLSYLFTGLFVGPTSQAPRVDEARHEALYELEIALDKAFNAGTAPPPWLSDMLFRNLLVDVAGNTHRAELSLDKLFDPQTATGRQGLVELRAFEMPPHARMVSAQAILVRALFAAFAQEPYQKKLVRFGTSLHDKYLLPYYLGRDLEDVLAHLAAKGVPLPQEAYTPFLELRCPLAGRMQLGDVTIEVRNALEPWPVLGEELSGGGTSRYVDSSMERIEVRVSGLIPERHLLLVNGHTLPLTPTAKANEWVAGVRFRAWAPPHSLHAHLGIHHPIRLDLLDTWGQRSLGACAYHVWHPEGRAFSTPPLTRFEASARRAQRFTSEAPLPWPVKARPAQPSAENPTTLDLRRLPLDYRPPKPPAEEETPG
ncbi:transglutaminase family protein [Hyalangium minutum]|uniref:Large protein containing transglutaminase-like domain protein n=1 Tax=Hyalangium minutum TaxID=394096 RepID=A0A085WQJ8_9BACT|nr:transglutaminase family protein [Hyalangium minutum]KFE69961.1 Large protein containing transglutaminase-like domain protein [Hyalangium minutum]